MAKQRYQPWRKGPARIIPFPSTAIVRAWFVHRSEGEGWIGEIIGGRDLLDEGPSRTEVGALSLVVAAVCRREARQGLPVVVDGKRGAA